MTQLQTVALMRLLANVRRHSFCRRSSLKVPNVTVRSLHRRKLIERGWKGECYRLTCAGWLVAKKLRASP